MKSRLNYSFSLFPIIKIKHQVISPKAKYNGYELNDKREIYEKERKKKFDYVKVKCKKKVNLLIFCSVAF